MRSVKFGLPTSITACSSVWLLCWRATNTGYFLVCVLGDATDHLEYITPDSYNLIGSAEFQVEFK